jgi:hypothetical protein
MFLMIKYLFLVLLVHPSALFAETENEVADRIAPKYNAKREVRCWDGTRVDLVTDTHVIEVDWAKAGKYYEAIGQCLYYEIAYEHTYGIHKKPGVLLLVKDLEKEKEYVHRTQAVCAKHNIRLWIEYVTDP